MDGKKTRADLVNAYVFGKIKALEATMERPATKAALANMRRGIGSQPGDDPVLWGMLYSGLPEELANHSCEPSRAEWSIYLALTLYALHMQGSEKKAYQPDNTLGKAIALLAYQSSSEEAVQRRFNALATAADITELGWHLRGMIQLLKSQGIGLNYPQLAKELYKYQDLEQSPSVRLQWGRAYYATYDKLASQRKEENDEE